MAAEAELARAFVALADTLVADFDIAELLQHLVEETVRLLDIAETGLLMADPGGRLQVLASTSEQTRLLQLFQIQAENGPSLQCYSTGHPVHVADLEQQGGHWPSFTAAAVKAGYRSVQVLPMRLRDETIGALAMFHTRPGAMSAAEVTIAQALADVATIAVLQQRALASRELRSEQLQAALNSRVIIEQAKGVLAERGAVDMAEAFDRLRGYARNHSERLVDTARAVVEGNISPGALIRSSQRERRS